MTRIVVVGAGISGLTVAYRLQQRLPEVEIVTLESTSHLGGTIQSLSRDGFLVEGGPNGFPDNNPSTLELARDLGLEQQLVSASEAAAKNRFLLVQDRLRMLPNSFLSLLTTDLLSVGAKFRLFTERFRGKKAEEGDESIHDFACRRVGKEIADTFVDAFVTGILAGDPGLISVQSAFPRLAIWERDHGSIMKGMAAARKERKAKEASSPSVTRRTGKMYSFKNGLGTLTATLASRLRNVPRLSNRLQKLSPSQSGWHLEIERGESLDADVVVLTCPAHQQAKLLEPLNPVLGEQIAAIPYNRVAVVAVGYRRKDVAHSLDGFGYLSPQRCRRDVLGVQWCSSIYPQRAPGDSILVRAMCGGWNRGEMVDWSDEQLLEAVQDELTKTIGVSAAPTFTEIIRWHRAIPQYHLGHQSRIQTIEEQLRRHPGLFLGGNAFRGVAINDCVEQSGLLADKVSQYIKE